MFDNLLYEIDRASNESENNVLEAIQESCIKALDILDNMEDDCDVSAFGVFQEATATAVQEPPVKTKESAPPKKPNNGKDSKTGNKDESVVMIDPRVAKAAKDLKESKKNAVDSNMAKLATVYQNKLDKYERAINGTIKVFDSDMFKYLYRTTKNIPKILKTMADAVKKKLSTIKSSNKVVQEAADTDNPNVNENELFDSLYKELKELVGFEGPITHDAQIKKVISATDIIIDKYFSSKSENGEIMYDEASISEFQRYLEEQAKETEEAIGKLDKAFGNIGNRLNESIIIMCNEINNIIKQTDSKVFQALKNLTMGHYENHKESQAMLAEGSNVSAFLKSMIESCKKVSTFLKNIISAIKNEAGKNSSELMADAKKALVEAFDGSAGLILSILREAGKLLAKIFVGSPLSFAISIFCAVFGLITGKGLAGKGLVAGSAATVAQSPIGKAVIFVAGKTIKGVSGMVLRSIFMVIYKIQLERYKEDYIERYINDAFK